MKDKLHYLGVADVTLIRYCLTSYEERLTAVDRHAEPPEVTTAVLQTLNTLRRLDRRLRRWVEKVDIAIDDIGTEEAGDDDIPF